MPLFLKLPRRTLELGEGEVLLLFIESCSLSGTMLAPEASRPPALRELMSQEGRQKNRLLGGGAGRAVVVSGVKAEMGTQGQLP